MTTNDEENKAIMGKQPNYSWQSSPHTSNHCSQCGGTGRVKKDAPDPGSLLEWKNKELLRKLGRCHEALKEGMRAIEYMSKDNAQWHEREVAFVLTLMHDALTDRGGANRE